MNMLETEKKIQEMKSAVFFLQNAFINCPKFPKDGYILSNAEILIFMFSRYTLRMLCYAEKFLSSINKVKSNFRFPDTKDNTIMTPVDDAIYFHFDAFIFSCKSICERNMIDRAQGLHPKVKPLFEKKAKELYDNFIKPILQDIRDEVVHLNYFGSSTGSIAEVTKTDTDIDMKFKTAFYLLHGKDIELIDTFNMIFQNMEKLFIDISGLLLLHLFYKFGLPEKNITVNATGIPVDYSYFKIPGIHI